MPKFTNTISNIAELRLIKGFSVANVVVSGFNNLGNPAFPTKKVRHHISNKRPNSVIGFNGTWKQVTTTNM